MNDQTCLPESTDCTANLPKVSPEMCPNGTPKEKAMQFLKLLGAAEAKLLNFDWKTIRDIKAGRNVRLTKKTIARFGGGEASIDEFK